jgi:hypothetical protein
MDDLFAETFITKPEEGRAAFLRAINPAVMTMAGSTTDNNDVASRPATVAVTF